MPLRNEALQQVLRKLMLAPGKRRNDAAGFISYAQLGINQLGAVYEGLMAYTGFYAHTDLYEVAKGGDPTDGTWMLPVADADEYPDDVFVMTTDEVTGRKERVMHPQGSFVFRLSGRDRQRSASYYTPEVLTRCVVKHALAELLGLDDYAPEHGSSGITSAVEMLDLTICEPALGSGAFANEAINQLSAEYLRRREAELGEVLNPAQRDIELQKVKAHFALHQTYGVDLNATAVELAEVSLWLNAMYPGLEGAVVRPAAPPGQQPHRVSTVDLDDEPARRPSVGEHEVGQCAAAGRPTADRAAEGRRDSSLPAARSRLGRRRRPQGSEGAAPRRGRVVEGVAQAGIEGADEGRGEATDRAGRRRGDDVGIGRRADPPHEACAAPRHRHLRGAFGEARNQHQSRRGNQGAQRSGLGARPTCGR